jgi:hypothetical protein
MLAWIAHYHNEVGRNVVLLEDIFIIANRYCCDVVPCRLVPSCLPNNIHGVMFHKIINFTSLNILGFYWGNLWSLADYVWKQKA